MNETAGDPTPDATVHGSACEDCDPGLLDKLRCHAKGVEAENTYNQANLGTLNKARDDYDAARHAYVTARKAARTLVEDDPTKDEPTSDIGKQVAKMLDQLRCLVNNATVVAAINEAFEIVRCQLEECYPGGCTFSDDCDFDDVRECEEDDIDARIADVTRRVGIAATTFATLLGEPDRITKDVKSLQAEIQTINDEMAKDSRTVDFAALYAEALVAQYHQQNIFNGFRHANAYVDCLCRTLTCQLNGHAVIAHLKRRQAICTCHEDARKTRCQLLKDKTADAVMAEYCRIWDARHRPHHESSPGGGGGSGCGCGCGGPARA